MELKPIHPFPARMAPSIVWNRLPASGRCLRVLDPMAGSGTTVVSARARGHSAIGYDTDPLAVLIAQAWCGDVDENELRDTAVSVLHEARAVFRNLTQARAYPLDANSETREFVRYWFDKTSRGQLAALSASISHISDTVCRQVLWCALSRLIITKTAGASLAMDVSHSRPHRVYEVAPVKPFDKFLSAVDTIIRRLPFREGRTHSPRAKVNVGDARKLPLDAGTVDMVITSPPYLNAIDYLRGHKLSLVWLGHQVSEIRSLRSGSIGSEVSSNHAQRDGIVKRALARMGDIEDLPARFQGMLANYVRDMQLVMSEIRRVLAGSGKVVIVIGDSAIRGVYIRNSNAIACLGRANGFRVTARIERSLPDNKRYLPPPTRRISGKCLQSRMRSEVILTLRPEC